jgi:hypothetical protein
VADLAGMISAIDAVRSMDSPATIPTQHTVATNFADRLGAAATFVDNGPGGSGQVLQLDSRGHIVCTCPACTARKTSSTNVAAPKNDLAKAAIDALVEQIRRTELTRLGAK